MSDRPKVSLQVIPFAAGARSGLLGHFVIASLSDAASIAYLETAADGQIVETPAVIDQVYGPRPPVACRNWVSITSMG